MGRKNSGGHIRYLGGKTQYRLIRIEGGKQRLEHRVVMEKILGRPLKKTEIVHHIDGNGLNNNPENLELISNQSLHRKEHAYPFKWNLEKAIEMHKNGFNTNQIAKFFGVTRGAIVKAFVRRGISTYSPRKEYFDREKAVRLYKEHKNLSFVARELGVSAPSIRKALIKIGVIKQHNHN